MSWEEGEGHEARNSYDACFLHQLLVVARGLLLILFLSLSRSQCLLSGHLVRTVCQSVYTSSSLFLILYLEDIKLH